MSQSLLFHAFGVREGYEYLKTEYVGGRVEFHLAVKEQELICPKCGAGPAMRRGKRWRHIRTVPIGLKEVVLVAEVPRCQCRECGHGFEVAPLLPRATRTTRTDSRTTPAN
ncbi:MAG: transposase family protein [Limisphaerales bacterium]